MTWRAANRARTLHASPATLFRYGKAQDRLGKASATIASAWAKSAGSTVAPLAPALSSSCSGRLAPTEAEATFGSLKTQASANWLMERSAARASGRSFCTASRTGFAIQPEMAWLMAADVARVPAGAGTFGWYLPESTPCASGDQTICEMPFFAQSGITFASGRRQSSEYCGWLDTKRSTPGMAIASSIFCGDQI